MSLILPSYQSGFAPRDYEPAYPSLWQGCVGAWAPLLGPTGLVLRDAVGKNDGVLTGMSANDDWVVSGGRWVLDFDGSNDWVNCGDAAACRAIESGLWTVSSWVYSRNGGIYFATSLASSSSVYVAMYDNTVAQINIVGSPSGTLVLQSVSFPRNQWVNATWAMSESGSKFYLNGLEQSLNVVVGTNNKKAFSANAFNTASLGAAYLNNALSGPHNSQLGETRVYNRPLQDNEIRVLASKRGIAYEPRRVRVRYFRGFSPKKKLLEAKITSTIPGSYQTGYAPRDGEPVYPELWKGCVGAWSAGLGPSNILRDNSPAENHGTLVNGPTYQVSGGQYAINMDGTDDGILTEAQGPATKNRSVSLWFNTAYSVPSGQFAAMLSWNEQNSNSAFQVLHGNGGNLGANGIGASQWGNAVGVTGLNDGKWHHLVIVNADQLWSIYADGIFRNSATLTTTPASNKIAIGRTTVASVGPGSNQNFAGLLDDIRVYSRALSPNEIKLLASQRNIAYAHRKKNIAFRAYDPIKQVGVGKITSIIPGGYHTGVGGVNNEPAYPELTKGLVGGWCPSLGVTGGLLRDNSGQGNHGVLTGMDPGTDWVVSGGKYALDFDGSNDLIDCGSRPGSDLLDNYSIFAWARPTASFVNYRNILSRSNGSTAQHGIIVFSTGIWYTQTADNQVTVGGQLTLDSWFHVGYTFQNGVMTTYQNGVAVNTRSGATNGFVSANFKIGNDNLVASGTQPRPFSGQIDDIRLYNRILSPNEIRLLASRRGIGYDYKTHRSYSKTQSSGLLKRLILTGQT